MPFFATIKKNSLASALALCLAVGLSLVYFSSRNSDREAAAEISATPRSELTALQTKLHDSDTEVDAVFSKIAQQAQAKREADARFAAEIPDKLREVQRQHLEAQASRLEQQTNSRVDALGERLGLSEAQRDQVFQILAKNSRAFDSQMGTAGEAGSALADLPDEVLETLRASNRPSQMVVAVSKRASGEQVSSIIEPVAGESKILIETKFVEVAQEELTPAEITKLVETEAIQQVLEPEQLDKYDTLLDEIDGYWGDLVTEVTKEIEAEEAAAAASKTAPQTTRQK